MRVGLVNSNAQNNCTDSIKVSIYPQREKWIISFKQQSEKGSEDLDVAVSKAVTVKQNLESRRSSYKLTRKL